MRLSREFSLTFLKKKKAHPNPRIKYVQIVAISIKENPSYKAKYRLLVEQKFFSATIVVLKFISGECAAPSMDSAGDRHSKTKNPPI